MPFVQRDGSGAVNALFSDARDDAEEWLESDDAAVRVFLQGGGAREAQAFGGLDTDFIRVLEDLIDTLIDRNLLRLTDLPAEAQRKLLARKGLRNRLRDSLDLLGGGDVI